jgi:hypothetical protein
MNYEKEQKIMKKSAVIKIRVYDDFKNNLFIKSKELGFKSLSDYIISTLNFYENKDVPVRRNTGTNELNKHLSRIGNNLNQIAYNINKSVLTREINNTVAKDATQELMYLNIQLNKLIEYHEKKFKI